MSGYDDLKKVFNKISREREKQLNRIYLARIVSTDPLLISNSYFGVLDKKQISILDKTKKHLTGMEVISGEKHLRVKGAPFKIGDEVLVMLYEQELEQKFIIIDKVVDI